MKIEVLNPFTLDADKHSLSHSIYFDPDEDPSLTKQADLETSDINYIVDQYIKNDVLPYGVKIPEYIDYSNVPNDFHAAQQFMLDANDLFMEYPADVRSRFDNDPGKFLEYFRDDANREEAIRMGFIDTPVGTASGTDAKPDGVPATPEAPAQSST